MFLCLHHLCEARKLFYFQDTFHLEALMTIKVSLFRFESLWNTQHVLNVPLERAIYAFQFIILWANYCHKCRAMVPLQAL